ncbi:multiple sugar transport system permease protein [Caloramator quimbayensis]|uniref:Multiple sugar transport system permease protein n=1 Tax=Caloramator quimbayensis TaxID=1147123 RepID=A0A1T4XFL1_9CLOT|nr:carbohydrate ABC transporter permease [Caloramator quimbayensis]SKA87988.1 multiple sugar transport system permease protein [Caloramator quimbayensis]
MKIYKKIIMHLILALGAFIMVLPFLWMITTSLKPLKLTYDSPYIFPKSFEFSNYITAWKSADFLSFYKNSIFVSICITLGTVVLSAMAAYPFARLNFTGKNFWFYAFLGTMMIPFYVEVIPLYKIIEKIGWLDTRRALIIPRLFSPFGIFLLRQYFLTIPKELDEAAEIDGASKFYTFWKIILPLSKPALASLTIFSFIFGWNDFLWPLLVTTRPEYTTVQVGISNFSGKYGTLWPYLMAGTVTSIVPVIIIFLLGQKQFIEGLTVGGIKE